MKILKCKKFKLYYLSSRKTRPINQQYLCELFSSDSFKNDYSLFLANLDSAIVRDNLKKVSKMSQIIEQMIKENRLRVIITSH